MSYTSRISTHQIRKWNSWPAAGFPNLGMKLSVLTSLPWQVLVRIGLYVDHVLVMLSPLVWTQRGCGCPGSVRIHTSRHDFLRYDWSGGLRPPAPPQGLHQLTIRIYVGRLGQFEFLETPRMNMFMTYPYSSTNCSSK